jgi:scyllo-inositol 2-dehydrogenase (NADP+)
MKIALVGLGQAGYTIHMPALAAMPGVRIVGAADPDAARRDRAAAKFGAPVFADFDVMLSKATPDVVIIGTPPDTHADYCLRAIAAGSHVICEKPFVSSLAEADRVIASAARARRRVAVNHQFREMPIFRAICDEAARIGTGHIAFAQVWQLMDMAPWAESGWRGQMAQRTLHEAGVHLIDFLMALFGEKPVAVTANTSMGPERGSATDAIALVTLEFSRGRLAHVTQNRLCKGPMQYFEVRAETPDVSLRASFGGRSRLSAGLYRSPKPHIRFEHGISGLAWTEVGTRRTVLARNPKAPMVAATRRVLEQTLEAFRTGRKPPTSAEDARSVLEVILACYESAAAGRRIRLDDVAAGRPAIEPKVSA